MCNKNVYDNVYESQALLGELIEVIKFNLDSNEFCGS